MRRPLTPLKEKKKKKKKKKKIVKKEGCSPSHRRRDDGGGRKEKGGVHIRTMRVLLAYCRNTEYPKRRKGEKDR